MRMAIIQKWIILGAATTCPRNARRSSNQSLKWKSKRRRKRRRRQRSAAANPNIPQQIQPLNQSFLKRTKGELKNIIQGYTKLRLSCKMGWPDPVLFRFLLSKLYTLFLCENCILLGVSVKKLGVTVRVCVTLLQNHRLWISSFMGFMYLKSIVILDFIW
jgi:hypothetical protein